MHIVDGALDNNPTTSITTSTSLMDELSKIYVTPANYTPDQAAQLSLGRISNKRYNDETFENYRLRLKDQQQKIKKLSRGVLVWDSVKNGTFKHERNNEAS